MTLSKPALKERLRLPRRLQLLVGAALVGVAAGLAAVGLKWVLDHGEGPVLNWRQSSLGPLLPAGGILASVLVMRYLFRDPSGHGVPEVIYAIGHRGGLLRLRTAVSRLVACALTLVTGGSAGPEAPLVMSGASIGSNIGTSIRFKEQQRIVMVGCGSAGAIAAIFNAPLAGILFTMEVVVAEWSHTQLVPIAISAVVGTQVSRLLNGNQIPFAARHFAITYVDLLAGVGLALLTALVSVFFIRFFRFLTEKMTRWLKNRAVRALVGGLLVGSIGTLLPSVLGEGYGGITRILNNQTDIAFALLSAMVFFKMAATAITSGAGGVGGIFAPSLVVGAMVGLWFRDGAHLLFADLALSDAGYYALLGMAGVLSSVLQAPLTGVFLIVEITGSYHLLVPVVLVSMLSATLSSFWEPHSFYVHELAQKKQLMRPRTDAHILHGLQLEELLELDLITLLPTTPLRELVEAIKTSSRNYFPVLDEQGNYQGMVTLAAAKTVMFDPMLYDTVLTESLMNSDYPTVQIDEDLKSALATMGRLGVFSLPVVAGSRYMGMISKGTIIDHYRQELVIRE